MVGAKSAHGRRCCHEKKKKSLPKQLAPGESDKDDHGLILSEPFPRLLDCVPDLGCEATGQVRLGSWHTRVGLRPVWSRSDVRRIIVAARLQVRLIVSPVERVEQFLAT